MTLRHIVAALLYATATVCSHVADHISRPVPDRARDSEGPPVGYPEPPPFRRQGWPG